MTKKSIVNILLVIIFLGSSCKSKIIEEVISTYPNGNAKKISINKIRGSNKELIKEIEFFENGDKQQEGEFKNGFKHGDWTYWYDNGNIWSQGKFENDLREGESIVYHKDGKINYNGFYKKGKPDGEWKFYDQNKIVKKIVLYENGKILRQKNLDAPYK